MTLASNLLTTRSTVVQPPRAGAWAVTVATVLAVGLVVAGITTVPILRWVGYGLAVATSAAALVVRREDSRRQADKNYIHGTPIRAWVRVVRIADVLVVLAASAHLAWEAAK